MQQLDEQVWVAGQITAGDIPAIAAAGFKAVICNRPDGEEPGQPEWGAIAAAAADAGMTTHFLPMNSRDVPPEAATGFAKVLGDTDGKVFAYCRSGARCAAIWNAAKTLV